MFRKCFIAIFVFSCFYSAGIVCVSSDEKSPFCFEAHTFSEAEIESMLAQKKTLNKLQQGIKPTNAELADNAMSLFNKTFGEELAVSGGGAALLNNLFQVPGFGFVDTSLTHAGGAIAVVQFMVDLANDKPEAQINLAKNASFWAVGTFNMFSRAVKISAVGVFAIDYALTSLGSTTITGRYDFWYRGYKKFYDEKYGNDMTKWEDLIFGTYKGDMDAFLKDGLMDFWKDAYINKEYTKFVQTRTFPRKDEQQKMKIQYLREEKKLEQLKKYIVKKRKEEKERLRKTVQNNKR